MRRRPSSWNTLATKLGFTRRVKASELKSQRKLRYEQCEDRRMLAITVDSPLDNIDFSDDVTTLREAIQLANNAVVPEVIDFASNLDGTPIILTQGELAITESVTFDAQGQDITIDADDNTGIFWFGGSGGDYEINGLKLTGGEAAFTAEKGGAIYSTADNTNLTLRNTIITGNNAPKGGGLYFSGTGNNLKIYSSTISNNTASLGADGNVGGGAFIQGSDSSVIIRDSIISNNTNEGASFGGTIPNGGGLFLSLSGSTSSATISNTIISGNKSFGNNSNSGGMHVDVNGADVLLDRLQVLNNEADDDAGGLFLENRGGEIRLSNSTITGNKASDSDAGGSTVGGGGGIASTTTNGAVTIIEDSTIDNNKAYGSSGGGIIIENVSGTTNTIINTTISGNLAGKEGGGISVSGHSSYLGGSINILHSTITNNRANWDEDGIGDGGGIEQESSAVTLDHTIVAGNFNGTGTTRDDISGSVTAEWSLVGDDSGATITQVGSGNQIGTSSSPVDPLLGSLSDNGGPTKTHKPASNSPVLDEGDPNFDPDPDGVPNSGDEVLYDQRGFDRTQDIPGKGPTSGEIIDIGAVELQSFAGLPPTIRDIRLDRRGTADDWHDDAQVSFATRVAQGNQFRSIATERANTIEIWFSEAVTMPTDGSALELKYTSTSPTGAVSIVTLDHTDLATNGFSLTTNGDGEFVGIWTFDNPLPNSKFAIHLDTQNIKDTATNLNELDAEWTNDDNGSSLVDTPDNVSDDQPRTFEVGDQSAGTLDDEFRFHFAILAGDYDGDHDVDGRDLLRYQLQLPGTDGNGDGVIDGLDSDVWSANFSQRLSLQALGGADFNDDEIVNAGDLMILLVDNYGSMSATSAEGDADGDGDVDGADFLIWQQQANSMSAWYDEATAQTFVFLPPNSVAGLAPFVYSVTFGNHGSSETPYDFTSLLGTGEQLRSVPLSGVNEIKIQFSERVSPLPINSLEVINLDGNSPAPATFFSYSGSNHTATWRFSSPFEDGRYLIRFNTQLTDLDGDALDGEINNPWSLSDTSRPQAISGDGQAGGEFRFRTTILANDTDRNNIDGTTDYTNWHAVEPGMIYASNTTDEVDGDHSFGDVSLREAVQIANNATEPTTIILPAGHYQLTRSGAEGSNHILYNDIDIS